MHYKNGEEAKVGHIVKGSMGEGQPLLVGVVTHTMPAATMCNLQVQTALQVIEKDGARVVLPGAHTWTLTASACERVA